MSADRSLECRPAILHVDMDAFFASVEVLDRPELAGRPVVVGGSGGRGVVASASYEARRFGVHSAMPAATARRLCPEAVFLPPRFARYQEASRGLREILTDCSPLVEPLGLDEAFVDVTGAQRLLGSPRDIAQLIRRRVRHELFLSCAVGIGRSKLVAKLASRAAKPSPRASGTETGAGVVVVAPDDEGGFLGPLPVDALVGVGPATARQLRSLGIVRVRDLEAAPEKVVLRHLGMAQGGHLLALVRGEDRRPVVADRPNKSLGHEQTFERDLHTGAEARAEIRRMAASVGAELASRALVARTVTVKVRFGDFRTITRSASHRPGFDLAGLLQEAERLVAAIEVSEGVRLLGVSASGLQGEAGGEQLTLPLGEQVGPGDWDQVDEAIEALRRRFGHQVIDRGKRR